MRAQKEATIAGQSEGRWHPVFIVNVCEESWDVEQAYAHYTVPGRKPKERFATLKVTERQISSDTGDNHLRYDMLTPREIAEDIIRQLSQEIGPDMGRGVFLSQNGKPTEDELAGAETRLVNWYKQLVEEANNEWERSRNSRMIFDLQRRAARSLGQEFEWCFDAKKLADCPGCGGKVKPNVAKCAHCGAILDRKRAEELGLIEKAKKAAEG